MQDVKALHHQHFLRSGNKEIIETEIQGMDIMLQDMIITGISETFHIISPIVMVLLLVLVVETSVFVFSSKCLVLILLSWAQLKHDTDVWFIE